MTKKGFDINYATPKDFAFNADYMTMKMALSGTLQINLPAETIVAGGGIVNKDYTDSVSHGLYRVPIVLPYLSTMYLDTNTPTDIILNEYRQQTSSTLEFATIRITNSQLTLFVRRTAIIVNKTFTAHKVTLYYTLFWNDITGELDLS